MDGEGIEEARSPESEEVEFAQRIVTGVASKRDDIDALIEGSSTNWRMARMPVVDRNILRMAVYELMDCQDIPATVSINEAVELAKKFGASDSRGFVNGIVDRIARQRQRIDGKRRR
jgi:N utilization substance protein B